MIHRLFVLAAALAVAGAAAAPAPACSPGAQEDAIRALETRRFVAPNGLTQNVVYGRVSRVIDRDHAEVEVIETFSGPVVKTRLLEAVPCEACGNLFSRNEKSIFVALHVPEHDNVIDRCSKLKPTQKTINRLRAISRPT
jgi:hypothetical protein